jgi:hypothetical protein
MAELATRMARKSASRQSPKMSVIAPRIARMPLKTVRTLARTMLAVERLVAGGSTGPRAARRRRASSSLRPVAEIGAVTVLRPPRLHGACPAAGPSRLVSRT